ncbi:MAG: ABC transporter substrate-binding protein [Rhodospirillaceae bacterium]
MSLSKPIGRRRVLAGATGLALGSALSGPFIGRAKAAEPIKIGEINSYSRIPAFTEPYRKGWTMALEQINGAGGIMGRQIEVISRDDGGKPEDAITAAQELVTLQKVDVLAGTFLSNVGLAVSDFAKRAKILFLAAEPLADAITWEQGNRYTFRLRPSTYVQAGALAREAAKIEGNRWATIAPNYEYGQSSVARFLELLKAERDDLSLVGEQWPALFKLDAGPTVQALAATAPDGIFNVLFGPDLPKFVREGTTRGLFENRTVVSMLTGEPEYLVPLGAEAPEGWIVTGYPWYDIEHPPHKIFVKNYQERFGEDPYLGSLVGYITLTALAVGILRNGGTNTESLIDIMEGMSFEAPTGEITFRAADHQSTMGAWVGKTALRDDMGVMVDWSYIDGSEILPSEEEAAKLRPAE